MKREGAGGGGEEVTDWVTLPVEASTVVSDLTPQSGQSMTAGYRPREGIGIAWAYPRFSECTCCCPVAVVMGVVVVAGGGAEPDSENTGGDPAVPAGPCLILISLS